MFHMRSTEEAAGVGGHDGPLLLPAETHPEDQQVQPPAAGHAGPGPIAPRPAVPARTSRGQRCPVIELLVAHSIPAFLYTSRERH